MSLFSSFIFFYEIYMKFLWATVTQVCHITPGIYSSHLLCFFFFIKTIFYSEISPNFTASPSCFISFYKLSNMFIAWNVSEILYTFLHYVIFVIHIRIGISPQGHHYSTGYIHNELLFLIQLWQLLIFLSFIFNTSLGESIQKVGRKL